MGGGSAPVWPLGNGTGRPGEGAPLCHRGHQHLQQVVVLAPAGSGVAVLGGSLDEFHADFVLLELHQEPVTHTETSLHTVPEGHGLRSADLGLALLLV